MTIEFTITNRKGQTFGGLIDDCDADLLVSLWHTRKGGNSFYVQRAIAHQKARIQIHRIIMERALGRELKNNEHVDHINGDGLDNRRANLRLANRSQNMANAKVHKHNKLGVKGVHKDGNKFRATIRVNGIQKRLGTFDSIEAAHAAYIEAAKKYHGEFARGA